MNILSIKNLTLTINNRELIKNISFNIKEGETFALVGESGSGKSLTSLSIMRLLPNNINIKGEDILFYNKSLFKITETQMQKIRGKDISMIFQEPMSALNPVMSIGEQLTEVLKLHLNISNEEIKNRTIKLLEEVAIKKAKDRYNDYPHQLSGGQKQRVLIAMALACEPKLLIADEPTTALDVTIQAQILKLLKDIQKKRNLSILFITHDMGVVYQMADSIAIMKNGEILEQNKKSSIFSNPTHPYTKQLLKDATTQFIKENIYSSDELLRVDNLKVHFPIKRGILKRVIGYIKAVDGINFTIYRGKTLAIVGESGSGKSTTGNAILKLIDSQGNIVFENQNISNLSQKEFLPYRRDIQVIFQDPYSALNPRMSIGEIIREGMVSLGVGSKNKNTQNSIIKELLIKVGLEPEHFYRYPHEFSGGQRQRIGIARALAVKPKLIVCDEVTSALDVTVRGQILKLLKKLQQEYNISYLFITHDLSIITTIADYVAVMKDGKIVEYNRAIHIMKNPSHQYTKKLISSAPKIKV